MVPDAGNNYTGGPDRLPVYQEKENDFMVRISIRWCFAGMFIRLAVAVLLAASCTKGESYFASMPEVSSIPVEVDAFVEGSATKGSGMLDDTSIRTKEYGVFAWWRQKEGYFDGVDDEHLYADNYRATFVEMDGSVPLWKFSPSFWWPVGSTLSMFAYAPYMDCDGPVLVMPNGDSGPFPRGTYTVPSEVASQADFCIAPMVYDRTPSMGNVSFVFNHALTRVHFSANVYDSEYVPGESDWVYRVESIMLSGLVGSNSFSVGKGSSGFKWDEVDQFDASVHTASYSVSFAGGLSSSYLPYSWDVEGLPVEERYTLLNGAEGVTFYLLPQVITNSAYVTFGLRPYRYSGGVWVDAGFSVPSFSARLTDGFDWVQGTTVSYVATINVR